MNPQPTAEHIDKVRTGQRLLLLAILLNFCSIPLRFVGDSPIFLLISGLAALIALVVAIIGILRMGAGLGLKVAGLILLCLLMLFPLINLVTLLVVNSKATKVLRENGYTVGLLGANEKA